MICHICITVSDLEKSTNFYNSILAPLGYHKVLEFPNAVGFGNQGKPSFWIGTAPPGEYWKEGHEAGRSPIHFAFQSQTNEAVDAFHKLGLELGAEDYGAPGLREHYHSHYYGAFLIDPDGNNIEAVCHGPSNGAVVDVS